MAEASWPFYGVETNEVQFSKWARALAFSGIIQGLAITPATGLRVSIGTGSALVRGVYYESDASRNITLDAAPTSGTRLDALILRLSQDGNNITLAVKTGSANSNGGTLPTLVQDETTWELLIGTVSVPAGAAAVTTGMIAELRPSTGLRVLPFPNSLRPTPSEPVALGINTTTNHMELWIGGQWLDLMQLQNTSGTLPINRGGSGATTAKGLREAAEIFVQPSAPSHKAGRVWIPGTSL